MHQISPFSPQGDISLGELHKAWAETKYQHITKKTISTYQVAWKHIQHLEKEKFKELRTAHWQKIINSMNVAGLSRSSMEKVKILVGQLYQHAMQNDIVNKNYAEYITLPKAEKKEKSIFSDFDIKTMFEHADTVPWVDTILIMIYTGMRISEMLSITKFNVDLDAGLITGGVKTEAGKNRIIPIHSKIMPFIRQWYDKNGEALICREDGKKMSAKYYREKKYYPALEQLKLPKLTPHSCRHTFASLMARAKVDPLYIQRIIGHTDYAFTANTYTHPDIEELKKAISQI